ncbi:MAG: hypothetical protein PF569_08560 [Candidatus Woesearchaeota archaeon]|jgi:hypothetical protein|nr:hypothetical protein [Candidatus Woesearchaeota archaeon]
MEIITGIAILIISGLLMKASGKKYNTTQDYAKQYPAFILFIFSIVIIILFAMFIVDKLSIMIFGV